jgi:hypothetical protein
VAAVGYKFSLILSREITGDESEILQKSGCSEALFMTDTLPTNADVTVTKMDFDDTVSPTLAEAIEAGLEAVKSVPDLSVPGLSVPAQSAGPAADEVGDEVPDGTVLEGEVVAADEITAGKKAAKKPAAKKVAAAELGLYDRRPEIAAIYVNYRMPRLVNERRR